MKPFQLPLLVGMLIAGTGVALASSGSLSEFRPKVMPVLVQVNAHGKVTDASPAMELSPRLRRLLLQNLNEMIVKPATDHGRPVSSQFVANLALRTTPRTEGSYDAQFVFVSSSPVPPAPGTGSISTAIGWRWRAGIPSTAGHGSDSTATGEWTGPRTP